jgi:hypothetical protein
LGLFDSINSNRPSKEAPEEAGKEMEKYGGCSVRLSAVKPTLRLQQKRRDQMGKAWRIVLYLGV